MVNGKDLTADMRESTARLNMAGRLYRATRGEMRMGGVGVREEEKREQEGERVERGPGAGRAHDHYSRVIWE